MKTLTLPIPFKCSYEVDSEAFVDIPVSKSYHLIPRHLGENAPTASFDEKAGVVQTTLGLAGTHHATLKSKFEPGDPALREGAAVSSAAHTALYAAAVSAADAAAPAGLRTEAMRFVGESSTTQDLESSDSFARVTWEGTLEVTYTVSEGRAARV